ncbi:MAG: TonB-dependent receptor [Myxococcales bacterium]|nr:TonB-dependent receptor [Myxococcales bacterium]
MRRVGVLIPSLVVGTTTFAFAQAPAPSPSPAPSASAAPSTSAPKPAPSTKGDDDAEEVPVEETEPAVKPDAKTGVLTGKLTDAGTGEEIIDGQCAVVGTKQKAVSDAEGVFSLKLPPGTYVIRCFYEGYKTQRFDNIVVTAGKVTKLDVKFPLDTAKPVEEIVVEVDPDRTTAGAQLTIRKNAGTVSDAVSAQEIAKTPDRNAAEASKRVVGASVVDGRFVYVRGLGDRYTNALLNGTPLPSPEPDQQAIPLDIFPVAVLSDVTIYKTFLPDMPGDFAGGSVRVSTRTFPSQFFLTTSFTMGYNSLTTFKDRLSYQGSNGDWLGSDSGARRMPNNIRNLYKVGGTDGEVEAYGESLSQKPRKIYPVLSGPNFSGSLTAGDSYQFSGGKTLGFIGSLGYGRRYSLHDEQQIGYRSGVTGLERRFDFAGTRSTAVVSLSALGSIGFQVGNNHRLTLTGLYSGNADDDVLRLEGKSNNDDANVRLTRARWVQRKMYFAQLLGEHKLVDLGKAVFKWNFFYGVAKRDEPNNVQSVTSVPLLDGRPDPDQSYQLKSGDALTHFYSGQTEKLLGGGLDWAQPLTSKEDGPKLKFGGLAQSKKRNFLARRFRFQFLPAPGQLDWLKSDPANALDDSTIGRFAYLEENTRSADVYEAAQQIYGAYSMADLPFGRFRLLGGVRVEYTKLTLDTKDDLSAGNADVQYGYRATDPLPAAAAVVKVTDAQNVRVSVTQTIARPQFREIAPFEYADFFNGQQAKGNPNLKRSRITNVDLRWEWFPAADEVVAVSTFYKHFTDAIEYTFQEVTSQFVRQPVNTKAATNVGVEIEGRKNLKFISTALSPLTLLANLTLVRSRVSFDDKETGVTNKERPLQGQSPYVVNLALDWVGFNGRTQARLSYNVFGKRIDTVGTGKVPDAFEMPRHVVDISVAHQFTKHVDAKVSVENLFDAPYNFQLQTGDTFGSWRVGRTVWVAVQHHL